MRLAGDTLTIPGVGTIAVSTQQRKRLIKEKSLNFLWQASSYFSGSDTKTATRTSGARSNWSSIASFPALDMSGTTYLEYSFSGSGFIAVGISAAPFTLDYWFGERPHAYGWHSSGHRANNGATTAIGTSFGVSDRIGMFFDPSTGHLFFSKNGVWMGNPNTRTGATFVVPTGNNYHVMLGASDNGLSSTLHDSITRIYPSPS